MNYRFTTVYQSAIKRFFQALLVAFLLWLVYFFYQAQIQVFDLEIINPFYKYIDTLDWWIYLTVYFIIVCMINIILLIVLNFYYTNAKTREAELNDDSNAFFESSLVDYLFLRDSSADPKEIEEKIKGYIRTKNHVISFFSTFTKIQEHVAYNLSPLFTKLIQELDLMENVEKLLKSPDFSDKILAFKVISYLRIKDYNDRILKYTSSGNYALRTESISALIRLSESNNLEVLLDYSHNISLLDVNVIVNAVVKNYKMDVDIKPFINSGNPNKVLIAVLLGRHRGNVEFLDEFIKLLGHENEILNCELWEAVLFLSKDNKSDIDLIVSKFHLQTEKARLRILSNELVIHEQPYFEFITEVVKQDESVHVKTKAMKILLDEDFNNISLFTNYSDEKVAKAFKEATDIYNN